MSPALSVNVKAILPTQEELAAMARRRYQHPEVQQSESKDKKKRYWYFRARIDVIEGPGRIGRQERIYKLGLCSEVGKREADTKRDAILQQAINRPDVLLNSQVKFGVVIDAYLVRLRNS